MDRSSRRPAPHSAATTTWVKKEMHHLHLHLHLSKTRWCLQFLPPSSRYQSWKLSLSLSLAKQKGARIHELLTCFRDGYYFVSFWALDAYLRRMLKPVIHCPLVVVVCGIMILLQSFADNPVKQQDEEEEGYGILSSMPAIWYHASTGRSFILSSMSRPATLIPTIIISPCL